MRAVLSLAGAARSRFRITHSALTRAPCVTHDSMTRDSEHTQNGKGKREFRCLLRHAAQSALCFGSESPALVVCLPRRQRRHLRQSLLQLLLRGSQALRMTIEEERVRHGCRPQDRRVLELN